jgi:hypothetical protein
MAMLAANGRLFEDYEKTLLESHQASKSSLPGTAIAMAKSLGIPGEDIISVRDPEIQKSSLQIPEACLSRHAYHKITIGDANVSATLETKVFGPAPYASGLSKIIDSVSGKKLEGRVYDVLELIQNGWI